MIQQTILDQKQEEARLQGLSASEEAAERARIKREEIAEIQANKGLSGYQKCRMIAERIKQK
jgi:hypothetical protein